MASLTTRDELARPQRRKINRYQWFALGVSSLSSLLWPLRLNGTSRDAGLVLAGALVVIEFVALLRWRTRVRITFKDQRLIYHGIFVRRVIDTSGCRLVSVPVENTAYPDRLTRYILVVNRDGRAKLALSLERWDSKQLETLATTFHLPTETLDSPMTSEYLGRKFPGVPWIVTNPKGAGWVIVGVAVAAVCVVIAL